MIAATATSIGTNIHYIAPHYFETMGIPLLLGRDVGWQRTEITKKLIYCSL